MPTNLTVILRDRPGSLADLCEILGGAGINIVAFCAFPSTEGGVVHLVVDETDKAVDLLSRKGFLVRSGRELVQVSLSHGPGTAGAFFRRLADANINVDLVYQTEDGDLVVAVDDIEAAAAIIG